MAETATPVAKTALVTGGSRGLGRGVVEALAATGIRVVALVRDAARLPAGATRQNVEPAVADVADPVACGRLLQDVRPDLLVLCAGALPLLRPLQMHTWETFTHNWEIDAKSTFHWLRDALLLPMGPGSHVIVVSSIAAVRGSPLSGSYAGAKRMQWLMTEYAAQEAARLKLGIRFQCVLPVLNPNTDLGRATIAAYARWSGKTVEEFSKTFSPPPTLTPAIVGRAVLDLHENPDRWTDFAYRVSGDGLAPLN